MRILIVEDEQELASAMRREVHHLGFAVDLACDGEEGEYTVSVF